MSTAFDFTKEEDRKKACEEYAKNFQNQLSLNAENRMTVLEADAKRAGLCFSMTNEAAYMQPRAMIKPVFELMPLEKNVAMTVTIRSGLGSDGFDVKIMQDNEMIATEKYNYGYNCSYDKRWADEKAPYVEDILQDLIDKHQVGGMDVEAGKNVFAGKDVTSSKVQEFKDKYCSNLKFTDSADTLDDFAEAVAGIPADDKGLTQ